VAHTNPIMNIADRARPACAYAVTRTRTHVRTRDARTNTRTDISCGASLDAHPTRPTLPLAPRSQAASLFYAPVAAPSSTYHLTRTMSPPLRPPRRPKHHPSPSMQHSFPAHTVLLEQTLPRFATPPQQAASPSSAPVAAPSLKYIRVSTAPHPSAPPTSGEPVLCPRRLSQHMVFLTRPLPRPLSQAASPSFAPAAAPFSTFGLAPIPSAGKSSLSSPRPPARAPSSPPPTTALGLWRTPA
jgi:hypothetical protein